MLVIPAPILSVMCSPESSSAGGIQGLLLKLHAALSDEDSRASALMCHDIVGDLGHECMLAPTENELGKTQSHVHQTPPRSHIGTLQTPCTNSKVYAVYASASTHVKDIFICASVRIYLSNRLSENVRVLSRTFCVYCDNRFNAVFRQNSLLWAVTAQNVKNQVVLGK